MTYNTQGTHVITWNFDDGNGNDIDVMQNVIIDDITDPTTPTLSDVTGECSATASTPTTTDNCSGTITGTTSDALTYNTQGTHVITWNFDDGNGNDIDVLQNVIIDDITNPTTPTLADVTGECSATATAPTTTDNCSGTITGTTSDALTYNTQGTHVITWNFDDGNGNDIDVLQNVIIDDITVPVADVSVLSDITGECSASAPAPTATDNCSGTVTATTSDPTSYSSQGTYTITWNYDDGNGNTSSQDQTVIVDDITNPVIPTLNDVTGQCSATATAPTTTDNCSGTVTGTTGDGLIYSTQGTFVITWSFDDGNGNEVFATQNVVVEDTQAPVPVISNLPDVNQGCQLATLSSPTATDNCDGSINGTTSTVFPITTIGTTVVTWTYVDIVGNISTQTQNVILSSQGISGGNLTGYVGSELPSDNVSITACPSDINLVTFDLISEIGIIDHWESSINGGATWLNLGNGSSDSYGVNFSIENSKTTLYRVAIIDATYGTCTEYSNTVVVQIVPPDVPPILDESEFTICLGDDVTLVARSPYITNVSVDEGGDFNSGQFPDKWDPDGWKIDGASSGSQWTAAGNNTKFNNWSGTNNHPVGTLYEIEYDSGDFKFGIAHGDYTSQDYIDEFGGNATTLETPIFSTVGLEAASLDFDQAYNLHAGDSAKVELSLDGGLTYTIVLVDWIGSSPQANSWGPVPYPYVAPVPNNSTTTDFDFGDDNSSYDLGDYLGQSNLRARWTFYGTTDESAWAIDNIAIPVTINQYLEWTDGIGSPNEPVLADGYINVSYNFYPPAPGVHEYGATALINSCRAYDELGTALATVRVNYAYAGEDVEYLIGECGKDEVALNAYDNTLTAEENIANLTFDPANPYSTSDDPGTGSSGQWSIVSTTSTCGVGSFSDDTDPTATFTGEAGTYILRWTLDEIGCFSDVQVILTNCNTVDFDGENDYITFRDNYNLGSPFTVEVWIKPETQFSGAPSAVQTIISKRDANSLTTGYDLRLTNNIISFNWNNGGSMSSPFAISTNRWYHIAVSRRAGKYTMYIDGIEVKSSGGSAPVANNAECMIGAMDQSNNPPNKAVNYFTGWVDELRIWNKELDAEHIHQMMNQQIDQNGSSVRGEIIPIDVNGPDAAQDGTDDDPIYWSDLEGYYRMDNIACGYLLPYSNVGADGKLRNITSAEDQTAPLPYTSVRTGDWNVNTSATPWTYGNTVWDHPNSTGVNGDPIDWNIVEMSHNIDSGDEDITLLGLLVNSGELTISDPNETQNENNSGHGLFVTHYLKLDGIIDLIGESQLIQKRYETYQFSESILDVTSSGYLERDQQGVGNLYRYSDWSSPVGNIGSGLLPSDGYTIPDVVKDGTDSSNPREIIFTNNHSGSIGTPITLSNRWIYAYKNQPGNYIDWVNLSIYGEVFAGEGFFFKGTKDPATNNNITDQNHVFKGKPHNGNINVAILEDSYYLTGNPYPSAISARQFISDNLDSTSGILYFWEHWGNDSHILSEYHAGYATYTLAGGVAAVNFNDNSTSPSNKIPGDYIPVAQGFYVNSFNASAGNIKFTNNQRVFVTEASSESTFFKSSNSKKSSTKNTIEELSDARLKIRISLETENISKKQILLTIDQMATEGIDKGFDAEPFELLNNDIYWVVEDKKLVIQALGNLTVDEVIPFGIVSNGATSIKIKIDTIENPYPNIEVYLRDNLTKDTYDIKNGIFDIILDEGEYNDKYSVVFKPKAEISEETEVILQEAVVFVGEHNDLLHVRKSEEMKIRNISLFNVIGQQIQVWSSNLDLNEINLPIHLNAGVYVVLIETENGRLVKKILIK